MSITVWIVLGLGATPLSRRWGTGHSPPSSPEDAGRSGE